jgi:nicotinate-nucleotide adenylyltransferase
MGHLMIAQMVREKFRLDRVIFIPCYLPPHKSGKGVIPARERLHMVRLAIQGNAFFEASAVEVQRKGRSYTIDTADYFRRRYPKGKLFYIIGDDHLSTLHTWRRIEDLARKVSFIAVYRPGRGVKLLRSRIKVINIAIPGILIASSDVRRRLALAKTVKYLVPDKVLRYIEKRRLYQ